MRSHRFTTAVAVAVMLMAVAACGNDQLVGNNQGRVRVVLGGDASAAPSANLIDARAGSNVAASNAGAANNSGEQGNDDRPSRWFQAANVTLSSVLARNLDGVLVNLDLDLPVTVDVVQIEGGKKVQLPDGVLPLGIYDQVVLVMTAAQGVMHDGTTITIEPPGGGWTALVPICPLEVVDGGTTTVGIDLMVRNSFWWNGNRFHFQPRFRPAHACPVDEEDEG